MKRLRSVLLLGLLVLGLLIAPPPSLAASSYFWFQVVDELGNPIASPTCHILTAATVNTTPTIYSDAALGTSKANPMTGSTAGQCAWYGDSATTSYDALVFDGAGNAARVSALTVQDHRVLLHRHGPYKHVRFAFSQNTSETDTGLDLPKGAAVVDVIMEVVTAVSGATVNVGVLSSETSGDLDGFAASISASVAGFVRPGPTYTAGSNQTYLSANTRGALLADALVGSDLAGSVGYYAPKLYIANANATSLVYQTSAHAVAGYIHVFYLNVSGR